MPKTKQVIVFRKDLKIRKGKFGAQVAHASMKFILDKNILRNFPDTATITTKLNAPENEWCNGIFTKIILGVDSKEEMFQLFKLAKLHGVAFYPIVDNGLTEFHGKKTLTCASFGPDYNDMIDKITGHLKPL